jgi:hypothetical protein
MIYRFVVFSYFFLSVTLLFSGCGGERLPPGIPKLYPAVLTVIQDGAPLADADIIMINTNPDVNWPTGGVTDSNGALRLRTLGRYNGAPVGTYIVAVSKVEIPDITPPDETSTPAERREYNRLLREIEDNTFYLVDPKFGLGATELEVEITPSNLRVTVDVSPAVRMRVPRQQ